MKMQPLVELEDVTKHYDNGLVRAVNRVSFSLAEASIYALTGPSGCGKSTLLNLIGALDTVTSGAVLFSGQSLAKMRALNNYRNRNVGFVFQFHHLIPSLSLVENVELPLYAEKKLSRRKRKDKALAVLEELGLGHRSHFRANKVSGGERQRAAVARALVNEPRLLLADEPTGSVDSVTAALVLDTMICRAKAMGTTVLITTHNSEVATRVDTVLSMRDGSLV